MSPYNFSVLGALVPRYNARLSMFMLVLTHFIVICLSDVSPNPPLTMNSARPGILSYSCLTLNICSIACTYGKVLSKCWLEKYINEWTTESYSELKVVSEIINSNGSGRINVFGVRFWAVVDDKGAG